MNKKKQHRKLVKLSFKAQECLSREAAKKIIKKAEKTHSKLKSNEISQL